MIELWLFIVWELNSFIRAGGLGVYLGNSMSYNVAFDSTGIDVVMDADRATNGSGAAPKSVAATLRIARQG